MNGDFCMTVPSIDAMRAAVINFLFCLALTKSAFRQLWRQVVYNPIKLWTGWRGVRTRWLWRPASQSRPQEPPGHVVHHQLPLGQECHTTWPLFGTGTCVLWLFPKTSSWKSQMIANNVVNRSMCSMTVSRGTKLRKTVVLTGACVLWLFTKEPNWKSQMIAVLCQLEHAFCDCFQSQQTEKVRWL